MVTGTKGKTQEAPKVDEKVTCEFCGKNITSEGSLERGSGHLCNKIRAKGWTPKKLCKVPTIPEYQCKENSVYDPNDQRIL